MLHLKLRTTPTRSAARGLTYRICPRRRAGFLKARTHKVSRPLAQFCRGRAADRSALPNIRAGSSWVAPAEGAWLLRPGQLNASHCSVQAGPGQPQPVCASRDACVAVAPASRTPAGHRSAHGLAVGCCELLPWLELCSGLWDWPPWCELLLQAAYSALRPADRPGGPTVHRAGLCVAEGASTTGLCARRPGPLPSWPARRPRRAALRQTLRSGCGRGEPTCALSTAVRDPTCTVRLPLLAGWPALDRSAGTVQLAPGNSHCGVGSSQSSRGRFCSGVRPV